MRYNLNKMFGSAALALIFALTAAGNVRAQGVISLGDDLTSADAKNAVDDIPDNISLFGDDDDALGSGILTPPAKSGNQKAIENAAAKKADNIPLLGPNAKKAPAVPALGPNAPKVPNIAVEKKVVTTTTTTTTTTNGAATVNGTAAANPGVPGSLPINAPAVKTETPGASGTIHLPAPAQPDAKKTAAAKPGMPAVNVSLGAQTGQLLDDVDDSVFSQMSDLEKQTAVLSLELRREKIKNEIEALKAVRAKAVEEERIREEERKQKQLEKEKEAEKKVYEEQQKLKALEIEYEKLRQEKLLKAYKNKLLEEYQKWVKNNAAIFAEISAMKKERQEMVNNFKGKFNQLASLGNQATGEAIAVKSAFDKAINDQQAQISILKALLESSEKANPFAEGGEAADAAANADQELDEKLSDVYAVMEIRGKGENLSAKLINKEGATFLVKIGTNLQTGHIVDDIQSTFIRADKGGVKDYLYFAAGGILDKEPVVNSELNVVPVSDGDDKDNAKTDNEVKDKPKKLVKSRGIPGIVSDMAVK